MTTSYTLERYDRKDAKSIESYAQQLVGHTFNDVKSWNIPESVRAEVSEYGNKSRKGGLGNFIEEQFFCYRANSESEADFPDAGVELKVTPYEINKKGNIRAGERLVLTMISYDAAIELEFERSHFWKKCRLLLLVYYLRDRSFEDNMDYRIDFVKLFTPPPKDLEIIMNDYEVIAEKIAAGKAHELSESDTMYLGASTKGATAEKSTVPQSYYAPNVSARKRAFCYKQSYMTYVLNTYLIPDKDTYEPIIKDPDELAGKTFEEYIVSKINSYAGKTDKELCSIFNRDYNNNKAQWIDLAYRMLGIKSNKAEEFAKAQIVVKAIRLEEDGSMNENSPLPALNFKELVSQEWEDSDLFTYFDETKFLFVVFRRYGESYTLKGAQLWNMPYADLNKTVYQGWEDIRKVVSNGVIFTKVQQKDRIIVKNNLPKKDNNAIIHIRPHTQKRYYVFEDGEVIGGGRLSDSDELPDGRRMTKQSFWLNNTYIVKQLEQRLKE